MVALDFTRFHFKSPATVDRRWLEWFREEYGRQIANLEFEFAPDSTPRFDLTARALPGIVVVSNSVSAMSARNLVARTTDDDLLVGMPLEGKLTAQNGGEAVALGTTNMMLVARDLPHQVTYHTTTSGFALRLRRSLLEPLVPKLADAVAKPFDRNSQATRLLLGYLQLLDREESIVSPETSHLVATHICDLLALALGASRDASFAANGRGVRAARLAAVKADILVNLADPNLSVTGVAERHGVTSRYVHLLFEAEGVTFSEYVVAQRLAQAHRMLLDPRFAGRSINSIAFDVGFGDLSYFNRRFRRRFGATPSDVRSNAGR